MIRLCAGNCAKSNKLPALLNIFHFGEIGFIGTVQRKEGLSYGSCVFSCNRAWQTRKAFHRPDPGNEVRIAMTGETRAAEQEGEGRQGAELEFMAFVIQVARRYRSALDQPLRSLGCGTAAMETMSSIANSRRALSQVEIANRMGIEGPTLTRMLALLEQKEWIIRVPDPLDGRAKKIKLTVAGKRALAKVRKSADKIRKDTLARISDEDMEVASKILNRILVGLMNRK